MNGSGGQTFKLCEAAAFMAGIDPMDVKIDDSEDLRIEPYPQVTINPEIGKRLGISRQAVDNAYKKAAYKVEHNRKNRIK